MAENKKRESGKPRFTDVESLNKYEPKGRKDNKVFAPRVVVPTEELVAKIATISPQGMATIVGFAFKVPINQVAPFLKINNWFVFAQAVKRVPSFELYFQTPRGTLYYAVKSEVDVLKLIKEDIAADVPVYDWVSAAEVYPGVLTLFKDKSATGVMNMTQLRIYSSTMKKSAPKFASQAAIVNMAAALDLTKNFIFDEITVRSDQLPLMIAVQFTLKGITWKPAMLALSKINDKSVSFIGKSDETLTWFASSYYVKQRLMSGVGKQDRFTFWEEQTLDLIVTKRTALATQVAIQALNGPKREKPAPKQQLQKEAPAEGKEKEKEKVAEENPQQAPEQADDKEQKAPEGQPIPTLGVFPLPIKKEKKKKEPKVGEKIEKEEEGKVEKVVNIQAKKADEDPKPIEIFPATKLLKAVNPATTKPVKSKSWAADLDEDYASFVQKLTNATEEVTEGIPKKPEQKPKETPKGKPIKEIVVHTAKIYNDFETVNKNFKLISQLSKEEYLDKVGQNVRHLGVILLNVFVHKIKARSFNLDIPTGEKPLSAFIKMNSIQWKSPDESVKYSYTFESPVVGFAYTLKDNDFEKAQEELIKIAEVIDYTNGYYISMMSNPDPIGKGLMTTTRALTLAFAAMSTNQHSYHFNDPVEAPGLTLEDIQKMAQYEEEENQFDKDFQRANQALADEAFKDQD